MSSVASTNARSTVMPWATCPVIAYPCCNVGRPGTVQILATEHELPLTDANDEKVAIDIDGRDQRTVAVGDTEPAIVAAQHDAVAGGERHPVHEQLRA